jgi:hypothetical protein
VFQEVLLLVSWGLSLVLAIQVALTLIGAASMGAPRVEKFGRALRRSGSVPRSVY